MMQVEKKYFASIGDNGGLLNADDSAFAVGTNQWVNAENVRVGSTDKGVTATLESVGGTLLLSTPSPSVSFIEIGSISDIVGNRIIYFYYNTTTSQHKIEVYDNNSGTIYLCLLSSQVTDGLGFSKSYPIHGRIINGVAYWTDNYNPPRKLNIDAAIKMNNPSYTTDEAAYTNPLEASVISLIRKPPTYALVPGKGTDGTITVNNIADFAGQFAWRYSFRDNEISVLSSPSKLMNYNAAGESYNKITVVATDPFGNYEHIPQDVQVVDFCVRFGNFGNFFIIKSWDKRIAAQAAEIVAHNNNITALNYVFKNDITGIALDNAYSIKPYDSVPLISETIETALNRLMLGNNLESYDTPVLTSLSASLVSDTNRTFQNPIFHSASPVQLGIIFRDNYKRIIGNVFTKDSLRLQIPERDYNFTTYYKAIAWSLSNAAAVDEIPEDAYYYEVVMTKDLRTRFFQQSKSGGMKYVIKDPVTGILSYQDTYAASAYGLAFNASLLTAEGQGYQYQDGDVIKIYQALSATIYSLAVIGNDANYIICKLQDLGSFAVQPNIVFEIYSPYKESISEPYWTFGETLTVTNPTQLSRTYNTISGNILGDVYVYETYAATGTYTTEHMSPIAKYWREWNVNAGEFNLVINSEQVRKDTAVRWSNTIIQGSQSNGLSSFDALDEKILPDNLGVLRKLQQTSKVSEQGNIMLAIGEQDTASLYLGEVQLVGSDKNAYLASSPNVIGTVNILKGNFGTVNPESVTEYRGNVYWLDANNGRYIQYSSNGLFPISNYKMTRFWKLWSDKFLSMTAAEIELFGGRPFVFSTVDPFHDELLISTPELGYPPKGYLTDYRNPNTPVKINYPFDILDYRGKVIVYNLKESRWMGSFIFYTEGFATLKNSLYSFRYGQMYLHNQFDNQCNFYGEQVYPKIMCYSNSMPSQPKSYNTLTVESNIVPSYVLFYNEYPYIQESDLVDFDFRSLEGVWNATLYRNLLQPTATGFTATSRLTGEKMRGVTMGIMLQFSVSGSSPLELKFLNIGYTISLGNINV